MEAVEEHYSKHIYPHVVGYGEPNLNILDDFSNLGGDRDLVLRDLTFLTLPEYGGAAPELHGSKDGEYCLKYTVGKKALQILLQNPRSALGPLFQASIARSRAALRSSPQFEAECKELKLDPEEAHLNVCYAKVNVYLRSTTAADEAASLPASEAFVTESGSAKHRDKFGFWARILASLTFGGGRVGGPVAELFFALLGYDGTTRLFGRRHLPREDGDLLMLLTGCQHYGKACALHGVQQIKSKRTHEKNLANAVVDYEIAADPSDSWDFIPARDHLKPVSGLSCPSFGHLATQVTLTLVLLAFHLSTGPDRRDLRSAAALPLHPRLGYRPRQSRHRRLGVVLTRQVQAWSEGEALQPQESRG